MRKYGVGKWKLMRDDAGLTFDNRSTVDLKDKWRNLEKRRAELDAVIDAEEQPKGGAGRPKKRAEPELDEELEDEVRAMSEWGSGARMRLIGALQIESSSAVETPQTGKKAKKGKARAKKPE